VVLQPYNLTPFLLVAPIHFLMGAPEHPQFLIPMCPSITVVKLLLIADEQAIREGKVPKNAGKNGFRKHDTAKVGA